MKYHPTRLRRALGLALAAALPLTAVSLHATLIAYDNFDTYVPGALDGLDGGVIVNTSTQSIGWTGAWTAATGASVSHEQIKYDHGSIRLGEGQSLRLAATSNELLKRLVPISSSTTYYVSFVFKIVGRSGGTELTGAIPTTATIFSGWQAVDSAPDYNNDTIGFVGREAKAGARVAVPTTTSPDSFVPTILQYGQAYFCVIKYSRSPTTNATFNSCQVWINPATGAQSSTNSATKTLVSTTKGSTQFAGILVRTAGLGENSYQLIDDLRIGTTWTDVTAAPPDSDHTIHEKLGWTLYNPAPDPAFPGADGHEMGIHAGGPLDQSALIDHNPAGTYGRLVVRNGRFEFLNRSGVPTRFAGVNFNFGANIPDDANAAPIAETIKRSGYNVVRLHHFDDLIAVSDTGSSFTLSTTNMGKLNKLAAELRIRGIYYNIDLFSTRKFSTNEINAFGVPNLDPTKFSANKFKALIPINAAALESWKKYARLFLNHSTSTSGIPWKNDPALVGICPVNEDDLYKHWDSDSAIATLYNNRFDQLYPNTPAGERPSKFSRFLYETHKASDKAIRDYLKLHTDIQTQVPLTGTNYGGPQLPLVYQRSLYDYVDEHSYFNHPAYGSAGTSALPHTNSDTDGLVRLRAQMPRDVMASRVFGKPFTITEWNACRPNRYRAEAAVIMPAYASLQDWDGLYCFQYADTQADALNGDVVGSFAIASDPIGLIASRLTALLFLRKDIAASSKKISWAVRPAEAYAITSGLTRGVSSNFLNIGLVTQVGMKAGELSQVIGTSGITAAVTSESPTPTLVTNGYTATSDLPTKLKNGGHIPSTSISGSGSTVVCNSDTGQITLNAGQGLATVRTARSELFALAPGASVSSSTKNVLQIKNGSTPATVCVIAVDSGGQSLSLTNRILVAHLTDVLPRGMKFADSDRRSLTAWGAGPHLIAGGDTDITLKLAPGTWTAHVLDQTGKPVGRTIPVNPVSGSTTNFTLKLSTVSTTGTQMLYELVRS